MQRGHRPDCSTADPHQKIKITRKSQVNGTKLATRASGPNSKSFQHIRKLVKKSLRITLQTTLRRMAVERLTTTVLDMTFNNLQNWLH